MLSKEVGCALKLANSALMSACLARENVAASPPETTPPSRPVMVHLVAFPFDECKRKTKRAGTHLLDAFRPSVCRIRIGCPFFTRLGGAFRP